MTGDHQFIPNSDGLNPGYYYDFSCETHSIGYDSDLIALPFPDKEGHYMLFHAAWILTETSPPRKYLRDFYFTHLNMNAEDGMGRVVEKNHLLLQDTNLTTNLTAVRHGNGRDWWVVLPRGESDLIYLFLLTPEGVQGPFEQRIGEATTRRGFTAGQLVFSPDGTKFARVNATTDGVDIFNFDRCRGVFSCPRRLPPPGAPEGAPGGAAVSPNSRYLYISARTQLFQYDLWANDIESSKVLIGEYDGFLDGPLPTTFYQQLLAPDGKIYMSATNGVRYLHTIHQPDSNGVLCDFRQHDLNLPTHYGIYLPNFPHFRLYDAPGSPCDTLGIDAPENDRTPWAPTEALHLTPNPTSGPSIVRFTPCSGGVLRIFDMAGRHLLTHTVEQLKEQELDCSDLPAGVYVVSFYPNGSNCRPVSAKLVVTR